jgi:hypothetical protein
MEKIHLKLYEFYFLLGLFLYTVGQYLIFIFFNDIDALHSQEPIDFAHWFMLIGVLLLIPQIGNFPKTKLNLIGTPILVIGIGLIIGMCVLDFVFWSINSSEFKSEVATHLNNTPAIWTPFMEVGGKVFTFGLLMSSCNYFKQSKLGVILVLIGTSIVYLPWGWGNIPGYLFITLGFYMNFYRLSLSQNGSK